MFPVTVFDTNILFSSFRWQGKPFECLALAAGGKMESVTCREILIEFEEILIRKRNVRPRLPFQQFALSPG